MSRFDCILKILALNKDGSLFFVDARKTKEILANLLEQLRDCKPYYKMKMVVIGKKVTTNLRSENVLRK